MSTFFRTIRSALFTVAALFLLLGLQAQAATIEVIIDNFAFTPDSINIPPGTTVRWINQDGPSHTSTSDGALWNSGTLTTGQQFDYTFSSTGVFPYHCGFHPSMTAVVVVEAPAAPALTSAGIVTLIILLVLVSVIAMRRRRPSEVPVTGR